MKMNKGRRNFYFRPGVVQLKSNFRHWNSSRILPPLIFFPREISLSFPLIFLVVTLHRFARRSGSSGIFILRRFEWLARNCLASRTLGKLERFAFIDFSFFSIPSPPHTHTQIAISSFCGFSSSHLCSCFARVSLFSTTCPTDIGAE